MKAPAAARSFALLAFFASFVVLGPAAPAQLEDHAHAKFFVRADGDDLKAAIEIKVDLGFHIGHGPTSKESGEYMLPTTVAIVGDGFQWSEARYPEAEKEPDGITPGSFIYVHTGTCVLYLRGKKVGAGDVAALSVKIHGQTCDAKGCVPYDETVANGGAGADALFRSFPADLVVAAAAAQDAKSPDSTATPANDGDEKIGETASRSPNAGNGIDLEKLKTMGLWQFLGLAVAYGFVALLMPCTYPMIPITISFFTKQASTRHSNTVLLAICYGLGIVAIYTLIGVTVGEAIIPIALHWATNLFFALMFVLFGLSMIGVFLLQPPRFLMELSGKATQKSGLGGIFLMGAAFVITSFTCTGPFVGSLLGIGAGVEGGRGRIALGMAAFGLTMGAPFTLLALLPGKVKQLPKSGEWMHALKVTLGFVELGAALKFFSNVDVGLQANAFPRELFLLLVAACFALTAFYLFGWLRLDEEVEAVQLENGQFVKLQASISPKRLLAGTSFFLLGAYFVYGAMGNEMDSLITSLAPPYSRSLFHGSADKPTASSDVPVVVEDDLELACSLAIQQKKLVLMNFTGFQ